MYGGDGRSVAAAPDRALTGIELSIVEQLAKSVFAQFDARLAPFLTIGCLLERIDQVFDPVVFETDRSELVVAQLRLGETEEWLAVALPARGLELARDRIAAPSEEAPVELDPNWSRCLELNVGRTDVEILAIAAGPPMLLGEIARLQPGSVIEFDAESLECVRIESDGEPIFEGRLGQSKGFFSVCVETPLAAAADDEADRWARAGPRARDAFHQAGASSLGSLHRPVRSAGLSRRRRG